MKNLSMSGAFIAAAALVSAPAFAWEPTKPVEIVVAAGAGGASDQMARMMQSAIQKNNLMKQPMVVSMKGGASGAEALMYMKSVSYTHLRAHETGRNLVCRLLLE